MQKQWNVEVLRCINAWANIGWDANEMIWPMNQWINERMESMNQCQLITEPTKQWIREWVSDSVNQCVNESLHEWISEWMNQWSTELVNQWRFSESMIQWIKEPMNPWINDQWSKRAMNQRTNDSMNRWANESVNPWISTNQLVNAWMDGWMDGMEQSGAEWSGVAWSGVEWRGVEWSGVEWVNGRVSEWVSYFFVDFFSLRDLAEVPLLSGAAPNVLSLQSGAHFSDLVFQKCSTHLNLFNILTCQLSSR